MASLQAFLPQGEGLLPKWLLLLAVVSVFNAAQNYTTLKLTQRVYCGETYYASPPASAVDPEGKRPPPPIKLSGVALNPVTPLSARTFGTWTFTSAIVRVYAAYHINEPAWYQVAFWMLSITWVHFVAEWKVFGSAAWSRGLASPLIVSTTSLIWMLAQWGYYVK
ncbi:Erg28 protein [Lineolata rhizophorae]|uniref:Erg28 protein n=1 Tax=Lineolata rhizophorae TaxID=578093 RepID=A0A6A6NTJ3_9PEZI|nr:Erg28 protein [Lineolata rhizophorae]